MTKAVVHISASFDDYGLLIFLFKSWSNFSFKESLSERALHFLAGQGKLMPAFAFSVVRRIKAPTAWYVSRSPENKLKICTSKLLLIYGLTL